ncbi:MAG: response regulator [Magnetococcales bacterium]|nr:response regulator [Magnetococcales bacterium]
MGEGSKPVILVVDDVPANIKMVAAILQGLYDLRIALNGVDALKIAGSQKLDLILLDVVMPGMDGYAVCKQLKNNPATRDIPVLFITGHADDAETRRGLDLGAADILRKPLKPDLLRASVVAQLA